MREARTAPPLLFVVTDNGGVHGGGCATQAVVEGAVERRVCAVFVPATPQLDLRGLANIGQRDFSREESRRSLAGVMARLCKFDEQREQYDVEMKPLRVIAEIVNTILSRKVFHFIRVANAVAGFEIVINQDPGERGQPPRPRVVGFGRRYRGVVGVAPALSQGELAVLFYVTVVVLECADALRREPSLQNAARPGTSSVFGAVRLVLDEPDGPMDVNLGPRCLDAIQRHPQLQHRFVATIVTHDMVRLLLVHVDASLCVSLCLSLRVT